MKTYEANSITEEIQELRVKVNAVTTCDPRIRAMINTHLQEAELLSLVLFDKEA